MNEENKVVDTNVNPDVDDVEVSEPEDNQSEEATYTKEDVEALLKNALKDYVHKDRVNDIVQKEKGKAKKRADEAARLAELTREQLLEEIEKINIEKEALAKDKEELEALKAESLKLSKENQVNQLKLETKKALSAANLSEDYFSLVFNEDSTADEINDKIQQLSKLVINEKKKEKDSIVKGAAKVPKVNKGNTVLSDKEKFKKMTLFERNKLFRDDPELYKRLSGK